MRGDTTADLVLGQPDFVHNGANLIDARGLLSLGAVAIDTSVTPNRLYVSDTDNNRVLGYSDVTALVSGAPADLVIGQPDFFTGPVRQRRESARAACATPGRGGGLKRQPLRCRRTNNRVLEYNAPFASCGSFPCVGGPANLVFGQSGSFTSGACNNGEEVSADSLCGPEGVAVVGSSANLYVVDNGNNRVLEYNTPLVSDTTADVVFGQGGNFYSNSCGGVSADSLCEPFGAAVDPGGNLYIADEGNNRVLEYNTPLTNTTADRVFGQPGSFNSYLCNNGGVVSADSLCVPFGVTTDFVGNLYVADLVNNRVLGYNTPAARTRPPTW